MKDSTHSLSGISLPAIGAGIGGGIGGDGFNFEDRLDDINQLI